MNTKQLNEELEHYLTDEYLKEYNLDLDELDSALYLWEHQLDWNVSLLDQFLEEIMPILEYTKISKEGVYPAFTNGNYIIARFGIKHPGGFGVVVRTIDGEGLFTIKGTMPNDSKIAPPADFNFEDLKDFIYKIRDLK